MQRKKIIWSYLNFDEYFNNQYRWLDVANFIGEFRSREIPNYSWQSYMVSAPGGTGYWTPERIAEHQRYVAADRLQMDLVEYDRIFIIGLCRNKLFTLSSILRDDTNYFHSLVEAAHLNPD